MARFLLFWGIKIKLQRVLKRNYDQLIKKFRFHMTSLNFKIT